MYKFSKNFKLSEFTKSATANRLNISNVPDDGIIANLKELCISVLQPLREIYGSSISINSGYRSKELNTAIGGSTTSHHCYGYAADIDTVNNNTELFSILKDNFEFDQLIAEFYDDGQPAWIHVSYKENNRNQILIAHKENNKTKYSFYSDKLFSKLYNK